MSRGSASAPPGRAGPGFPRFRSPARDGNEKALKEKRPDKLPGRSTTSGGSVAGELGRALRLLGGVLVELGQHLVRRQVAAQVRAVVEVHRGGAVDADLLAELVLRGDRVGA